MSDSPNKDLRNWIIIDEVADFTPEQWKKMAEFRSPLLRWNPNTSSMEPFSYTDEQKGSWYL